MLAQEGPLDHPIYFASRRLSAWELYNHRTFFIMIRPTPKTQDWAPELLITTYQKEECDEFIFSRFDYKPDSEDEKKKHKLPRSCSRLSRCHLRWMAPYLLKLLCDPCSYLLVPLLSGGRRGACDALRNKGLNQRQRKSFLSLLFSAVASNSLLNGVDCFFPSLLVLCLCRCL